MKSAAASASVAASAGGPPVTGWLPAPVFGSPGGAAVAAAGRAVSAGPKRANHDLAVGAAVGMQHEMRLAGARMGQP